MPVKAERIEAKYLKPGDLFSEHPPEFFASTNIPSIMVFLCMAPMPDDNDTYFRLTVENTPEPTPQAQTHTPDPLPFWHNYLPPGV